MGYDQQGGFLNRHKKARYIGDMYGSRERHFSHCGDSFSACGGPSSHAETCFPRAEDRCSVCGGTSSHEETRVSRVEDRLRRRRFVFRVRRTLSACGDSYSACGGPSPHAEIGVPRAENLASYVAILYTQKAAL